MARWAAVGIVLIGGLLLAGAATLIAGASLWRRDTASALARLRALPNVGPPGPASCAAGELPAPVARYFARALSGSRPAAHTVRITWTGEFRMRPEAGWVPFEAIQDFTIRPPGFVWDAGIRMLPLVAVRVRDRYGAGAAGMRGRIGGLVPVVDAANTPELAQSALVRWIGEAVWFPVALLPGDGVRWEAIDDSSARIVVTDGRTTASAEFHFAATGEAVRMTALRYRDVDGTAVLTAFEGIYRDHTRVGDVIVPMKAEVAWLLPEGRYAYWRGSPAAIRYGPETEQTR